MDWKDRIYCGDLTPSHVGRDVLLMGWVDAIRDHGNLLFIHLRDNRGIVQVVFDPKVSKESYERSVSLREEYVVEIRGKVALREKDTENPNLETGDLEVFAKELTVLAKSKILPFQITEKAMVFGEELTSNPDNVDEELRLQFRYLDLRRPSVQELFVKRHRIMKCIRDYFHELNFTEVETPFLTKSTPEGARDYLVPSRIHQGRFYALPQSPQLFKQLLMMSGMDRYFQIVRCFRDEDLRPNRQPEFTQLDMEASFIDEEFIYQVIEGLAVRMFELGGITLNRPFPRMTHREAMERYGTDRPDTRFDMAFREATDLVRDTAYSIFKRIIDQGGRIKGFCVKGQAKKMSKNLLQHEYAMRIVPSFGAKGMTWMKVVEGELQSNIAQFFNKNELERLRAHFDAQEGDVLLMIADTSVELLHKALCSLRLHVAERMRLIPQDRYSPLWVTDFPLFEMKNGGIVSNHHPFTMPDRTDFDPSDRDELLSLNSRAYDLVVNGEELGGGSIRIHQMDIQEKIFQALGLTEQEVETKFGFFLRAMEYGAPPHGGLALGLDRVIAMILKTPSIRDVIAFPKNRSAICPLAQAPSAVEKFQIKELGLDSRSFGERPMGRYGRAPGEAVQKEALAEAEKISTGQVKHVANLARLKLTETEVEAYRKDLNAVLDHFETLQALDTETVHPMSHVLEIRNVWREDEPGKSEKAESILSNAPKREYDYFKVSKILEG